MASIIDPTRESFSALKRDVPPNTPIVMLNLLRFRAAAAYPADSTFEGCSGREAYARYSDQALPAIVAAGGSVVFSGTPLAYPIAAPGERWDEVLLVRYPDIQTFFGTIMNPDYQKHTVHRTAALEEARLICTHEAQNTGTA